MLPEWFELDEAEAARRVGRLLDLWLDDSGLKVSEMVELAGRFQPKQTMYRGAWARWKKSPKSLSVLAYLAIEEAARQGLEHRARRRQQIGA